MSKKPSINRRTFITAGVTGAAAAIIHPYCTSRDTPPEGTEKNGSPPVITRVLGRTGLEIPVIGMGSQDTTSDALIRRAIDSGIVLIATAKYYLNGKVEESIGRVIKDYPREKLVLVSGVAPEPMDYKTGSFSEKTDMARYEEELNGSLKRLGVDYLDILGLPFAAGKHSVTFEPVMRTMENFKKAGKARFLGIATHSNIPETLRAAADTGFYDAAMPAYNFRFKNISDINDAIDYACTKGLGIIAMKTIVGNALQKENQEKAADNPRAALKWVLQNPNVCSTVPGFSTFDQLETDLSVMEDLTLNEDDLKYLETVRANHPRGLFCQGCGTCLLQCSSAPDIPTLMRGYMYMYGYRNPTAAARALDHVKDTEIACIDCSVCTVDCPMGFNIREKICDIIRLRDVPRDFLV